MRLGFVFPAFVGSVAGSFAISGLVVTGSGVGSRVAILSKFSLEITCL